MKRKSLITFISAGALSLAMGGTAMAAGEYGSDMKQDQAGMDSAKLDADVSNMYKTSQLQNLQVNDSQGQEIGNISEVLVDQDGKVSHVVISQGGVLGVGGENYLVPWDRVQIDPQQQAATIDIQQGQLGTEFSAFEELPPTRLDQDQQQMQEEQPGTDQGMPGATGQEPATESEIR